MVFVSILTLFGTFHFGSSLMVALVKGPLFYLKCFQTFVFRFIVLV